MFEGEYLNGEKYGKEYYNNGKIKFEGEYLDGNKMNGKLYDNYGETIYDLKNGNGKVKEYDFQGNLIFEGE